MAQIVALVVDPDPDLLGTLYRDVRPDIIQLHGTETPEFVANVRHSIPGVGIWKALPVAETSDVGAAEKYMQPGELADLILFDAKPVPGAKLPGGNGLSFDWTILDGLADRFPFVLAGGLNPDNVAAAIKLTKAAVVDVSSGVESRPGKKKSRSDRAIHCRCKTGRPKCRLITYNPGKLRQFRIPLRTR